MSVHAQLRVSMVERLQSRILEANEGLTHLSDVANGDVASCDVRASTELYRRPAPVTLYRRETSGGPFQAEGVFGTPRSTVFGHQAPWVLR